MKVGVSGSTSGIGQQILGKLSSLGHTTVPIGRNEINSWKLGEELPTDLQIDSLVHLAHDRSLSLEKNIEAAKTLCGSFQGPKVFLSSFSAHSKSLSIYGRSKYAIESIFQAKNGCSIRAGVVYGGAVGGIYSQLELLVKKLPLIPIPYGASSLLFATHIDDLTEEMVSLLMRQDGSTTFGAHPSPMTLNALCALIQESLGLKKTMINMPQQPIDSLLRVITRIMPNFPMADSLLSLSSEVSYEEISKLKIPNSNFRSIKDNLKL